MQVEPPCNYPEISGEMLIYQPLSLEQKLMHWTRHQFGQTASEKVHSLRLRQELNSGRWGCMQSRR